MNRRAGSAILSKSFYGDVKFKSPAVAPGVGSKAALKAARLDESRLLRSFATQQDAFDFCDSKPGLRLRVWSFEIDGNGRRKYAVASYDGFWRFYSRCLRRGLSLHFYEVLRERHACKLYFDLEYVREHNENAKPEEMIDALIAVCAEVAGVAVERCKDHVTELDSTTEKKFSRHLIFEEIAFHDNTQIGDFVRQVLQKLVDRNDSLVLVRNKERSLTPFIDLGVYTRNRCFRLVGSSKFGKVQRLVPIGTAGRLAFSKEFFLASLVCNVRSGVRLRGTAIPVNVVGVSQVKFKRTYCEGSNFAQRLESGSPYRKVDEYVLSIVEPHGGGIYGVTIMAESDTVMYAIKGGYKYCANVDRHHKSNNVILIADLASRRMYQKCFDPDCRGFRSAAWELPRSIFGSGGGEVSDDALVDMMEQHEACWSDKQVDEESFELALVEMIDDVMSCWGNCARRRW